MTKRICFDLRPLQIGHENRGIGMVIISILENLIDNENEYLFYTFNNNNPFRKLGITPKVKKYQIVETPYIKTEVKRLSDIIPSTKLTFHRFKKLKPYRPDVFVQFDFTLGLPRWHGIKTYTVAYDLIPLIMKNYYLPSPMFAFNHAFGKRAKIKAVLRATYYRIRYRLFYKNYKRSDNIVSISEATTKSFIDLLGIQPDKITTIPLAPVSSSSSISDIRSQVTNIEKPYVFYIGGTDSRKRVDHIVYAYNIVRSRGHDINLVLAGNEFQDPKTIPDNKTRDAVNASPYKKDMYFLGFVTDAEKDELYKNAHAFVFCSLYEGFGLPIIEAEANSCPIVTYNNSSIPEAAGNAALMVESNDYVEAANKIIELFDTKLREKCIKKGLRQAAKFSWASYAKDFDRTINN